MWICASKQTCFHLTFNKFHIFEHSTPNFWIILHIFEHSTQRKLVMTLLRKLLCLHANKINIISGQTLANFRESQFSRQRYQMPTWFFGAAFIVYSNTKYSKCRILAFLDLRKWEKDFFKKVEVSKWIMREESKSLTARVLALVTSMSCTTVISP